MVSRVPTFSGKLIGQKIAREYVLPVFVLAALFMALLLTYPSLTLAAGSVIYLAHDPALAPIAISPSSGKQRRPPNRKAARGKRPRPRPSCRRAGRAPEDQTVKQRLSTYLRQLEAESIHIMREVAAEFRNPVMLYSIGKDSLGDAASRAEGVLSGASRRSRCCTSTPPGSSAR